MAKSNESDELNEFLDTFRQKLDINEATIIFNVLKKNKFNSRMQIKLITQGELDVMFNGETALSLGALALLRYQINFLNDQSPLPKKSQKKNKDENNVQMCTKTESISDKKPVLPAFAKQMETLREQLHYENQQYKEIEFKLESMKVEIREPPPIGNSRLVCSQCHHRGHRNQSSRPCKLKKCVDYTYCGLKDKHIEYQTQVNGLQAELKKKREAINKIEQQIQSMENFTSHSEYHFSKNLTPRLLEVDKTYNINRVKLMRDIRMLRKFCDGKIPEVTSDDAGQLKALLIKCRKTIQQDCRDYEVEDTQGMVSNSSDINLNVAISPQISPVQNAQKLKTENACDNERKVRKKKSKRRKKRSRHSSTSGSEDESRHRSPRRRMLFNNLNSSAYSTYNHPAVDPFFSHGHHMPYMIPAPYAGAYAAGSNIHYPYSAGIPTTQQPISFGNVIAPQHCQGVSTTMAQQNRHFNYEHQDALPTGSSNETHPYTNKDPLSILSDAANVSEKM